MIRFDRTNALGAPGPISSLAVRSGRLLTFDGLQHGPVDRDRARLLLLGDQALELDVEQSVLEPGAADFHMLGELEAALERAPRDALIEITVTFGLLGFVTLAGDGEQALARLDVSDLFPRSRPTASVMR